MTRLKFLLLSCSILISTLCFGGNFNDTVSIYKFDIKQEIGPSAWRHTQISLKNAKSMNADLVLIHMNTYGGAVDAADSIRTAILNSKIPVYVFIDNNAASAGALISIACDRIYMRPGSNIGAATVVNQTGEVVPDKYQSFMRSMMRSTAESHGKDTIVNGSDTLFTWHRDPNIAQAMVDPSIYVEGISDTGKVLTFTTLEAIEHGFCEGQAEDVQEVIQEAGIEHYTIEEYKPTTLERIIDLLINPYLSSILIMIIIGGIYFELQTPGIGFPIAASILAAIVYFAPLYLEGLAENWEVLVFIAGVALIALEIFAIPGFGVAGISGIFLVVLGLTLSMVDNVNFEFDAPNLFPIVKALFLVMISFVVSLILSILLSKRLLTTGNSPLRRLVLKETQQRNEGYLSVEVSNDKYVGQTAESSTVLRPSGKVLIDGEIVDAKSESGFIDAGIPVLVVKYEHGQLYVKKIRK
jgi:membrane-bound serine protease (ClpP class)